MNIEAEANAKRSEQKALHKETTYTVEGRRFVVTPVFQEDGRETFGSILMRLMRADATAKP